MRILVTGGAGFIGSHVVDELVAAGMDVTVLDSLRPDAHRAAPEYLNPGARYIFGDMGDPEVWPGALAGVEAVTHQAAKVGYGVGFDDVEDYVLTNDLGTATMLRALAGERFRGRLVLASSMVVYGEGRYRCGEHGLMRPGPRQRELLEQGVFEPPCPLCGGRLEAEAVPEDARLDPRNVYAATKVHQEHLCAAYARETGASVIALRYHNVYGPRMPRDTPYTGVAGIFRSALERGEAPQVYEDGKQRRDFVHVLDAAHANVLALTASGPEASGPFNVASGRPHMVGEMAQMLALAFGQGAAGPVVTGRYRMGDVRHVFASTDRAATVLGFRASVGFAEGMKGFATATLRPPLRGVDHGAT